jgi:formate--tetrahydrofolate ligase
MAIPSLLATAANRLGLGPDDLIAYGDDKAKVRLSVMDRPRDGRSPGRLILVSAITPTPAGEGKTTTSIGLAQAMEARGENVCLSLREPSLGPVFGMKGGGTGGGKSRLEPSAEINLHFNGDLHAVTAAHNLLSALIDNHLHFGGAPELDPNRVLWPRVMDMNDRALRDIVLGLGGSSNGVPRQGSFDITAASEVMAILCLSSSLADLRVRLSRILVGFTRDRKPVTAGDLDAVGAMVALLRDALVPNLVVTTDGTPALVHGGPFANIAHGCSSVLATRMGLHLADWVVTEGGFGMDLGGEKFMDIKCVGADLRPAAVVLVATVRALKLHGGVALKDLNKPDPDAVARGLPNLMHHLDTIARFGPPAIVAINLFPTDTEAEIDVVTAACAERGVPSTPSAHFALGGQGALSLADLVVTHALSAPPPVRALYDWSAPVVAKITAVAQGAYGARDVVLSRDAERDLSRIEALGFDKLPVCIAKTQYSLSDDATRRGRPTDFTLHVEAIKENTGAGFLVVVTGEMMRMPGLPKKPAAAGVDVVDGRIIGVE